MQRFSGYAIGLVVGIFMWLMLVLITQSDEPSMQRFEQLGGGLAPIGSLLTATAVVFAFEQHHRNVRIARLDKLADAYARWLELARATLIEMQLTTSKAREVAEDAQSPAVAFHRTYLMDVYLDARKIRAAAWSVLLREDDEQCQRLVKDVCSLLPRTNQESDDEWRAAAVRLDQRVTAQLATLDELFNVLVKRLRTGSGDLPAPTESDA